jgi:hypothetical protein
MVSALPSFVPVLVILLSIAACQKNSEQGGRSELVLKPEQIIGSWEPVSAFSASNGGSMPSKPPISDDPYSRFKKVQYLITDTTFTTIVSDELVASKLSTPYTIKGAELVTPEKDGNKVYAFTVLELTADSMTVKPSSGRSEPADLIFHLKRIKTEELATKTLKVVAQKVSFEVQSTVGSIDTGFSDPLNSTETTTDLVSCYDYNSDVGRQFQFSARHVERTPEGKISWSSTSPSIALQLSSPFDLSKQSELVSMAVDRELHGTGDEKMRLMFGSKCALKLQRVGRILDIAIECPNLMASSSATDAKGNASLKVKGQCGLVF